MPNIRTRSLKIFRASLVTEFSCFQASLVIPTADVSIVFLVSGVDVGAVALCVERACTACRRVQDQLGSMETTLTRLVTQSRVFEERVIQLGRLCDLLWNDAYARELWNSYKTLKIVLHPNSYTDTYATSGTQQSVDANTPTRIYYFCYNPDANEVFLLPAMIGGFG